MKRSAVQAWINSVAMADTQPDGSTTQQQQRIPDTPSPLKRARTSRNVGADEVDDEIAELDLDKTPVRPRGTSTRSASSLPTTLASRPILSAAQPSSETSSQWDGSVRSRSNSPAKRFQKVERLLGLAVPVHFTKKQALGAALPPDAQTLLRALSAVQARVRLLPAVLRSHPDFGDDELIHTHMWSDGGQGQGRPSSETWSAEEHAAALRSHEELRRIVDKSVASSNKHRSESSWNNLVHTPLLEHATRAMPFLEVEPIMSAHIMPAFRPLLASGEQMQLPSTSASSATGGSSVSGHSPGGAATPVRRRPAAATISASVHKMVDYALTLQPADALRALIDEFLRGEPWERQSINQTRYEPLRACPAPLFIETKTTSGTQDGASVQLGIWLAAWHERMRTLAALAGSPQERLLTLPVIQVVGGVWSVMYAVDEGTEIRVLYRNSQIGETDSMLGMYELQASLAALGRWVEGTFQPWFTDLLTRAVENR
ncbi:hypothetical protein G3M48_007133, partial [Beauveria asiatica]